MKCKASEAFNYACCAAPERCCQGASCMAWHSFENKIPNELAKKVEDIARIRSDIMSDNATESYGTCGLLYRY